MEIEVLEKKVADNQAKIDKKLAYIEKNKLRMEKLIPQFEKLAGASYPASEEFLYDLAHKDDDDSIKAGGIYYKIIDCRNHIINSESDIKKIQKVLDNWQAKLDVELEKSSKRRYPVLEEFLDNWEKSSVMWLKERFDYVEKSYEDYLEREETYNKANNINVEKMSYLDYIDSQRAFSRFKSSHGVAGRLYFEAGQEKETYDKLVEEFMAKDKKLKYDDLIDRAEYYVGDITDTSNLSISPKGELDGVISGTKGKVEFKTIGAGGYNIQRFHYRVLTKKIE